MKATTFLILILVLFFLIWIIVKLIRKESFVKRSDWDFRIISSLLPVLLLMLFQTSIGFNYVKYSADRDRIKYHIPCIDSTMELTLRKNGYESWHNKNSIEGNRVAHTKEIEIDITGIFSEKDWFIYENKTLELYTRVPGFLRTYRTSNKLINTSDYFNKEAAKDAISITTAQADSILHSWNLAYVYDCNQ